MAGSGLTMICVAGPEIGQFRVLDALPAKCGRAQNASPANLANATQQQNTQINTVQMPTEKQLKTKRHF